MFEASSCDYFRLFSATGPLFHSDSSTLTFVAQFRSRELPSHMERRDLFEMFPERCDPE